MEEWKEYTIGDLGIVITGKTPKTTVPENYGGEIPFLTPSDDLSTKYAPTTKKNITQKGLSEVKNCLLPAKSICVTCIGSDLGKVVVTKKETVTNQQINSLIVKGNFNVDFIYYLMTIAGKHLNYISKTSTAVPIINKSTFSKYSLHIPSKSTQDKIAAILSSLDDKIAVNRKISDNLEQQAQALFKSWLSQCKKEVTIGDLSQNIIDYTKCNQDKVVLINSSDVTEGHFEHHVLTENKNLKGHFKKRFRKGDILYSQVRPRNRHWGYCTFDADNYLASTQLMIIRNNPELISSILLYQYIIDDKVWNEFTLKTETRSGTFPQGNYAELSSIKVPFGAEINSISSSLENLYSKIFCNERESQTLSQLRDTLLPKLMSGELKVNEI